MKATYMYGVGDVRVIDVPDAALQQPTDALVRVVRSCVCGSDLHPYHSMPADPGGTSMGHEFIGVVEEVGDQVATVRRGDFVIAPFAVSCGTCVFCHAGLQTSCVRGGFWNDPALGTTGGQAEAVRVPLADGTLVTAPVDEQADEALLASLLTLSDVYGTGWHAAVRGGVREGSAVTVIGDGAVGLLAVLSARQLGAEQIVLMGRHKARTDLGIEFGATEVVAERGAEGIAKVRELTGGLGSEIVLEAVGHRPAYDQALGVIRPGGVISRVGVPQYEDAPIGFGALFGPNITLTGGPAPVRAYIEQLLPAVLNGTVQPGLVFDRTTGLDHTPQAYAAMDARDALKVAVRP
ncbi:MULTISPECIES: alcohol dehydrogenase catalytic domain-containing protein [unclassified Rhodococcus (in: high G+C Gram-positive bacteria)]|uniref:alcohol dehydrogenase catalytic domain-containing protein n=1 Tax=unclassified Rhodococcus (in: high G+C Gram-positive bacteria) TaxID=192944 RepID=UPI00163B0737|nr:MULTISPECIES: alcohol dehydrogenase catalytic domain-containing protein [unclassified Rhodococcus (in: high G+C Gram-positive bacteria)]MBC2641868.1 alcohol dehydrogenase catalytic domain-containing protein [Rhodococcus sp. 3A]MBC2893389.1 alcohol dehydrogenase catalytic domain-containing protein [Rhodococcus sp. 4CII]